MSKLKTLGDAVLQLISDSGEIYAEESPADVDLTPAEQELFMRLVTLSAEPDFSSRLTVLLEQMEKD